MHQLDLARVHTRSDLDTESPGFGDDRCSDADRARGLVERGEKAVARRHDLASAMTIQLAPDDVARAPEQFLPVLVATGRGMVSRIHDVREQDGCENAICGRDATV